MDKIMVPFFTTLPIGQGPGLGLSISHEIIKNLGGELYVDTSCQNTKFCISIPVDYAAQLDIPVKRATNA